MSIILYEWFNGTHKVRVFKNPDSDLGVRIQTCMANDADTETGPWENYAVSRGGSYKEFARVLAEGFRYMERSHDPR